MEPILGMDLGTTNSVVSVIRDGQPMVLRDPDGSCVLPSAVGVDGDGRLLVGQPARNQAVLAPDRTILSVKRRMGEGVQLSFGTDRLSPQEVSAIILRTLKERAEHQLGHACPKAVITVPALFNENQRAATREAGELAGLEVLRIVNEPTAAALTYQPPNQGRQRLVVYDLGGGTFDVSIVQIEGGVVEVLSSHGDTHLGGDDFDALLLDHVCDRFDKEGCEANLKEIPTARSRLLQAVERAKCKLSDEAYVTIQEPFLTEWKGAPVNLDMTVDRSEYEALIEPLLQKTIQSVDAALTDANLNAQDIDKVILVGGSSRTPMVRQMLQEQLGQQPHLEVDPDLCVSMGAAIQGGLIAGLDLDRVLVDITPRTLGVRVLGTVSGIPSDRRFSPLIHRNSPLPATRSEFYYTAVKGQKAVEVEVYQGENDDITFNDEVGSFVLEGLDERADENSEIMVRFELDLNGTLGVTVVERATALEKQLTIDNAVTQFRTHGRADAKRRLAKLFVSDATDEATQAVEESAEPLHQSLDRSEQLIAKANRLVAGAPAEDAAEIEELVAELRQAVETRVEQQIDDLAAKLEDVLFYLEDA